MKKITTILLVLLTLPFPLSAQENAPGVPLSRQIYSFSPLAHVYLNNLGLIDTNNNGVIDRGAGEGYEEFTAKYGNADVGFYANCVTQNANNGKLEEPEIVNHYYLNIRFKPDFQNETTAIESEIKTFVYANNIPLVWLDDEQGTVMNAVNRILGDGWNERQVIENEAIALFNRAMQGMRIRGRTGNPGRTGYYTLPEFVTNKAGYCFETAQFAFWFFSEMKINSVTVSAFLTTSISHSIVELTATQRKIDYFDGSSGYNVAPTAWNISNPIQSVSAYYSAYADKERIFETAIALLEYSAIHNKYDIANIGSLMLSYERRPNSNPEEIIDLGEYIIQNINIDQLMNAENYGATKVRNNLRVVLRILRRAYEATNNHIEYEKIQGILNKYW